MAPITRRAAKALGETPSGSPTDTPLAAKSETLFEEPIALRSRRKPASDASNASNASNASEEGAEAATPRDKKLDVRIQDEPARATSSIEVQIPSSALKTPRPRSSPVPDSQDEGASDEGNQTFEPLSASKQLEEEATQKLAAQSRLESGQESTPLPKAARSTRASPAKKSQDNEPTPLKESESEAEETPRPKATNKKSTHVVFGDDDDVDKFVAAAAEKEKEKEKDASEPNGGGEDKEEQEDSDDEAPEAVSTAAAAKETLKSARAAIEAAEQYAASTKRKRQARDNLLKQQAEKRKRTKPNTSGKEEDSSEDEKEDKEEEQNITSKRQRRTHKLPDMLPAEFLTDSSEDEDDKTALKKMIKRPQKITFETAMQVLGAEGKGPRDEVVGSTRYRVLAEQGDPRLAPKANKNSRRVKEDLLRRGRDQVTLNKKRGFFVKR
ncbi:hypothetical protein F4859DRAFT_69628 [Xylaria cf. heliscus]|nr:hypothetical protein F4859DRAFT_69628 [Xylaria cf. heliscus]